MKPASLAVVGILACHHSSEEEPIASTSERLQKLGATPCPDLDPWLCLSLEVPLDHADPGGPTIQAAFAVLPATGEPDGRLGMLVSAQGGPGYSGIAWADGFQWIDPSLRRRFDAVAFDLRGLFASGGLDCPEAANAWFVGGWRASDGAAAADLAAKAQTFSTDCAAEIGLSPEDLAFYNTDQAVEDLEAFRSAIEEPELTLYGLSYGTQYMQTYATTHPDHTRAVLIDGVVDLTVPDLDYAVEVADAQNDVLARTLAACDATDKCASDFPSTAEAGFDAVAASLQAAPALVDYPLPGGTHVERQLTRADLDTIAYVDLGDQRGRAAFLHALAAARGGDYEPMLRRLYTDWLDEEDLIYLADPSYADAGYYIFTCNDYGRPRGASAAESQAPWLATLSTLQSQGGRLLHSFGGDMPCATWPSAPIEPRRPPAYGAPVPTMLINATADTATPFAQGHGMVEALVAKGAPVSEVLVSDGHHVMFGYDDCVSAAASAFLIDPSIPSTMSCEGGLVGAY